MPRWFLYIGGHRGLRSEKMLVFEFPPLLYLSPSLIDLVIVEGEEVRDGEDEVLEDHATATL